MPTQLTVRGVNNVKISRWKKRKKPGKTFKSRDGKQSKLSKKELNRIEEYKNQLIAALKILGNYIPELDGLYLEQIAKTRVYLEKTEKMPNRTSADIRSITYIRTTLLQQIHNLMDDLAASRAKRLGVEFDIMRRQLEELIGKLGFEQKT